MKKIVALAVGLALACGLLAGCQSAPKEIPPYFPHNDSLRLDATEEELLATEEVEPETLSDGTILDGRYLRTEPAFIEGIPFQVSFSPGSDNSIRGFYLAIQLDQNFAEEYQQLDRCFSKLYGKGETISTSDSQLGDESFNRLNEKDWSFTLGNGKKYHVRLSHVCDTQEYKGHIQYYLNFYVGLNDT